MLLSSLIPWGKIFFLGCSHNLLGLTLQKEELGTTGLKITGMPTGRIFRQVTNVNDVGSSFLDVPLQNRLTSPLSCPSAPDAAGQCEAFQSMRHWRQGCPDEGDVPAAG